MSRLGPCLILVIPFMCYPGRMEQALDPVEGRIRSHLAAVLESAGVTPAFVVKTVQRIDEALDARRVQRIKIRGENGEDRIETFNDVDHGARLSASDRALDLATRAGLIPAPHDARRNPSSGPAINVNIMILSKNGEKKVLEVTANTGE